MSSANCRIDKNQDIKKKVILGLLCLKYKKIIVLKNLLKLFCGKNTII